MAFEVFISYECVFRIYLTLLFIFEQKKNKFDIFGWSFGHFLHQFINSDFSKMSLIFGLMWTHSPIPLNFLWFPKSILTNSIAIKRLIDLSNWLSYQKLKIQPIPIIASFGDYIWIYAKCKALILIDILYYISLNHSVHYRYWSINSK